MSYILDALKRADAERERGAVPGLHARQLTPPAPRATAGVRSRLWLAVAAALTLGGIAAGLWVWRAAGGDTRPPAVEPAVASITAPAPLAQPVPAPVPIPPVPSPSTVVPAAAVPASTPALAAAPAVEMPSPPRPKPAPVAEAAQPAVALPSAPKSLPVATASTTQDAAAVPLLSELAEGIRRQIPALAITGAVYSEYPAQRILIVNNQVLTQGSQAAPEVNLEEIQARSSVFSFRGTRFRVAH